MKIISRKRFVVFMLLVSLFLALLTSTLVEAVKNIKPIYSKELTETEIDFIEKNFEQVEVKISKGDTAWIIQKSLAPNYDIRQLLYLAEKLNGKNMGNILVGETLLFLKEK